MKTTLANCTRCGVGITAITNCINCGYCMVCYSGPSHLFHLPKTLRGPADVAAVAAELNRRENWLLLEHWQRIQMQQQPGDELLEYCAELPRGSLVETHYGVLWRRGDELRSVLHLDSECRNWRETEPGVDEFVTTRFATTEEVEACPPVRAARRPGDRVLHYEYWELEAVRRLERIYEWARQPREFERLLELHQATLLMEGRTGLVLIRDWRCVLRVRLEPRPGPRVVSACLFGFLFGGGNTALRRLGSRHIRRMGRFHQTSHGGQDCL